MSETEYREPRRSGRGFKITAVANIVGAALAVSACSGGGPDTSSAASAAPVASTPPATPDPSGASLSGSAPGKPPARACATAGKGGPATAPAGAVAVTAGQDLGTVVDAHPAGTTYWLAPGTHRLGTGEYDQVRPHTGDTFTGASGAVLDGQQKNRYAFVGDASDVTISGLVVQNFGAAGENNNEGVVNHDAATGWKVSDTVLRNNAGAGMMVGSGNVVTGNCFRDNGQYAFNAYRPQGVRDVVLDRNEISGNNTDDWERRQPGCGCTGGGKFWDTNGARVTNNYVHDNHGVGLWADTNNANFLFQGNYIADNAAEGIMYEISYNAAILNNTFVRNALEKGPTNPGFPASAVYLSESGSDSRVAGAYSQVLRVAGNVFTDNWAGIVAWENADRFAGSPANTSSGSTTLVNPKVATAHACATPAKIAVAPYKDDCRWKTQNLLIENNTFDLTAADVPKCTAAKGCGFNGVFSNYGTYPDWSPFKGTLVSDDITYKQHNVWKNNSYHGPWGFMAEEAGRVVSWDAWRSAPLNQDAGSSRN